MADEEGSGGALVPNDQLIAQYQTTRIRGWSVIGTAGYKRLLFIPLK